MHNVLGGATLQAGAAFLAIFLQLWCAVSPQGQGSFDSTRVPGDCTASIPQYDCGEKCIPLNRIRDCVVDCNDGSDEDCTPDTILCDNRTVLDCTGKCVQPQRVNLDCADRMFSRLCNEAGTFPCRATANCFLEDFIMDGNNDCFDFSDEDPCWTNRSECSPDATCEFNLTTQVTDCTCKENFVGDGRVCEAPPLDPLLLRIPGACSSSPLQFDCGNGFCIPVGSIRNCVADCPDGIDESCWRETIRCDGCKCIAAADAAVKCRDQRPPGAVCSIAGAVKCNNSNICVFPDWILDGNDDCGDSSDEDACYARVDNCSADATCEANSSESTFNCTCNADFAGDGVVCTRDVDPLLDRIPGNCSLQPLQFDCGSSCISISQFRDCKKDCPDGSDEACWEGTVQCSDCKCVPAAEAVNICAGGDKCFEQGRYPCLNNEQCLDDALVLDGVNHCTDGSDESICRDTILNCTGTDGGTCVYSPLRHQFLCDCPSGRIANDLGVCQATSSLQATTAAPAITTEAESSVQTPATADPTTVTATPGTTSSESASAATSQATAATARPATTAGRIASVILPATTAAGTASVGQTTAALQTTASVDSSTTIASQTTAAGPTSAASGSAETKPATVSFGLDSPRDCAEIQTNRLNQDGVAVYDVFRPSCLNEASCVTKVLCDFSNGGGWTVAQRRIDGSTDFWKTWQSYRKGFGDLSSNFWLGNEYLMELTTAKNYDLVLVVNAQNGQEYRYTYLNFSLGAESENYVLHYDSLAESDGQPDNLATSKDQPFGTWDQDSDQSVNILCGSWWQSGWWFEPRCVANGNLNVPYDSEAAQGYAHLSGIMWVTNEGTQRLTATQMMLRPHNFAFDTLRDCADVESNGLNQNSVSVYDVFRPSCPEISSCATKVLCDFSNGGGWTIVQRRINGSTDFWRTWQNYKNGFGDVNSNFWLGNEYLVERTTAKKYDLAVVVSLQNGQEYRYTYSDFSVGTESENYILRYGALAESGGQPDNLAASKDQPFGTWDRDTDQTTSVHCGSWWKSGWWFEPLCAASGNLNVPYDSQEAQGYAHLTGIMWPTNEGAQLLASSQMMIRPQDFTPP